MNDNPVFFIFLQFILIKMSMQAVDRQFFLLENRLRVLEKNISKVHSSQRTTKGFMTRAEQRIGLDRADLSVIRYITRKQE